MLTRLDYEPKRRRQQSPASMSNSAGVAAVGISLAFHLLAYWWHQTFSGGISLGRVCLILSVLYWLFVGGIIFRAGSNDPLTKSDVAFIAIGYPIIVIPFGFLMQNTL